MTTTTLTKTQRSIPTPERAADLQLAHVQRAFAYLMVEPTKRDRTERDRLFASDLAIFGPARENCGSLPQARPGYDLFSGFSEAELDVTDMVPSGDRVIAYVNFSGIHTGEFEGHGPTGRRMSADGMVVFRFCADGLIAEQWSVLRWR